ncbi:MAG: PAS-domain containing protein [Pelagimonas sp.]
MTNLALTQAGLNLIQQAISIYDSDLKLAVCNARFVEMFNLPVALTVPGARFADTIRHLVDTGEYGEVEDVDAFVDEKVGTALDFQPHYVERTRSNGRMISVEGAPLPHGGWVTVYTDITETKTQESLLRTRSEVLSEEVLKRSEELSATNRQLAATNAALLEARRELTEMEARTRATTEMMPAHIARVDADGRYTFSNRRLPSVMPGRQSNILGQHISKALGDQAYERVKPHLEAAFDGTQSTFEFTHEASSRRIRVVFTPDPLDPGVYILSQDVTEETQTRAALQQTKRREMAAQLTSGMAHDFSNLLTIILGMQSKLAKMDLGEESSSLINATLQAARRGGTLLNRLADITAHRAWRPKPVHVGRFLTEIATLATPSLPEGIKLEIRNSCERPLMVDTALLQDAILNMVLNARDACGPSGHIRIEAEELKGTWLQFTICDTGTGFSDNALEHALDPFFTTKGGEGSGLGLAMVYDMTKLAGGEVRLSNTDMGACVRLRLPLRPAERLPKSSLVLLVEDSTDLRASIREMLTDMALTVVEAASVPEARALAEGLPDIALVLSDISLEGEETGVDLAMQLLDMPMRLMTSLPVDHPLNIKARTLAPVLAKPFTASDLSGFLGYGSDLS